MADITYNDPLVTESKLTEFYNDIKPFLGCPAYVTQEGSAEYYSTEEKVIGRWIDNKPLYQRTLFISNSYTSEVIVPNTGTGISVNGITDVFMTDIKPTLDKIINIQMDTNNRSYSGSSFHHSYQFRFNKDNGYVATVDNYNVGYQENIALYPGTSFTFKYTKSTDSAVTTIEQKPTHYSTDEQVVGTWTDGKPVYQRTYTTTVPNASSNGSYAYKNIAHNITNVDKFVDVRGTLTSSEFSSVLPFFTDGGNKTKFNINATDISIANDCVYSNGRDLIFTVRYTKATD